MKSFINQLLPIFTIIGLLLIVSCNNENLSTSILPVQEEEEEEVLYKIKSDGDYSMFMESQSQLFEAIKVKEIDLITMHDIINTESIQDYCSPNSSILNEYDGAKIFFESICQMNSGMKELKNKYPIIQEFSEEEIKSLFAIPLRSENQTFVSNNETATERGASCLEVFQTMYIIFSSACSSFDAEGTANDLCEYGAVTVALGHYNTCCLFVGGGGC